MLDQAMPDQARHRKVPPSTIRPTRDRTTPADQRQCGAGENQIDQDELFDCHVNSSG
ncbi:hypothetical protein [Halomonas cupida]|uniref:hypothetical protein n=1 Tax=Halomonas cupida TaxID=44933 RepID=UPI003A911B02